MARKRNNSPEEDEVVDEDSENIPNDEDNDGDGDEKENRGRGRQRSKMKKKKRFKVMATSGQSEVERRTLRRHQRELQSDIAMGTATCSSGGGGEGEGEGGDGDDELQRLRNQNNALWDQVHYTREAVLDSENVDLIANKAARQAEKMVEVPRYDPIRLAQCLVKKGAITTGPTSQFNWRGLGFQVGVCFNSLPSHVSFLYGPLDAEYTPKERKKPERRKRQTELESEKEEEQPEDVDQTGKKKESDGNELSAVEKHIKVIRKTLHDRSGEKRDAASERAKEYESQISQEVDDEREVRKRKKKFVRENSQVNAVNCLFNPKSFTQTVENVFHFSFLVKEGFSGIKARSVEEVEEFGLEPGPVIRPIKDGVDPGNPKQAIVSLNMKDWRDMCNAYNVEASDVPHREHGKVATKERKRKN
mmetsp:Transcript_2345/g.4689  ORF Transcript_2345/g.4689 Transcript_2345/m.4689 type:complete len:418 (-) Transcript_2345:243-1496(-)|eukprot:CAMPEP_0201607104 /NCGR_PEP_ID=MMETSP0492-20130828/6333_1 /ASSEMBLY_ACC=CAM_ASM_000837 /TAXON_ID=420259 /ORGANISM="Thalassiosira gravida, Strain GMp14c1" /LENGTH=417 /DNA_ID=CAMNT_0048071641 /DNA_START=121 /DNA_END=1374 /DNA_ORIENTATION=-